MRSRVVVELTGGDGCVSEAILAAGERVGSGHTAATLGLTLTEGKAMVAASQQVAVRAQVSEHGDFRRRRAPCGAPRPVKDHRARTLIALGAPEAAQALGLSESAAAGALDGLTEAGQTRALTGQGRFGAWGAHVSSMLARAGGCARMMRDMEEPAWPCRAPMHG